MTQLVDDDVGFIRSEKSSSTNDSSKFLQVINQADRIVRLRENDSKQKLSVLEAMRKEKRSKLDYSHRQSSILTPK